MLPPFRVRGIVPLEASASPQEQSTNLASNESLVTGNTSAAASAPQASNPQDLKRYQDGIIRMRKSEYEELIKGNPRAALRYLDESDGEVILVGSTLELSQRLQEPYNPHDPNRRRSSRHPAASSSTPQKISKGIHEFEIERAADVVEAWGEVHARCHAEPPTAERKETKDTAIDGNSNETHIPTVAVRAVSVAFGKPSPLVQNAPKGANGPKPNPAHARRWASYSELDSPWLGKAQPQVVVSPVEEVKEQVPESIQLPEFVGLNMRKEEVSPEEFHLTATCPVQAVKRPVEEVTQLPAFVGLDMKNEEVSPEELRFAAYVDKPEVKRPVQEAQQQHGGQPIPKLTAAQQLVATNRIFLKKLAADNGGSVPPDADHKWLEFLHLCRPQGLSWDQQLELAMNLQTARHSLEKAQQQHQQASGVRSRWAYFSDCKSALEHAAACPTMSSTLQVASTKKQEKEYMPLLELFEGKLAKLAPATAQKDNRALRVEPTTESVQQTTTNTRDPTPASQPLTTQSIDFFAAQLVTTVVSSVESTCKSLVAELREPIARTHQSFVEDLEKLVRKWVKVVEPATGASEDRSDAPPSLLASTRETENLSEAAATAPTELPTTPSVNATSTRAADSDDTYREARNVMDQNQKAFRNYQLRLNNAWQRTLEDEQKAFQQYMDKQDVALARLMQRSAPDAPRPQVNRSTSMHEEAPQCELAVPAVEVPSPDAWLKENQVTPASKKSTGLKCPMCQELFFDPTKPGVMMRCKCAETPWGVGLNSKPSKTSVSQPAKASAVLKEKEFTPTPKKPAGLKCPVCQELFFDPTKPGVMMRCKCAETPWGVGLNNKPSQPSGSQPAKDHLPSTPSPIASASKPTAASLQAVPIWAQKKKRNSNYSSAHEDLMTLQPLVTNGQGTITPKSDSFSATPAEMASNEAQTLYGAFDEERRSSKVIVPPGLIEKVDESTAAKQIHLAASKSAAMARSPPAIRQAKNESPAPVELEFSPNDSTLWQSFDIIANERRGLSTELSFEPKRYLDPSTKPTNNLDVLDALRVEAWRVRESNASKLPELPLRCEQHDEDTAADADSSFQTGVSRRGQPPPPMSRRVPSVATAPSLPTGTLIDPSINNEGVDLESFLFPPVGRDSVERTPNSSTTMPNAAPVTEQPTWSFDGIDMSSPGGTVSEQRPSSFLVPQPQGVPSLGPHYVSWSSHRALPVMPVKPANLAAPPVPRPRRQQPSKKSKTSELPDVDSLPKSVIESNFAGTTTEAQDTTEPTSLSAVPPAPFPFPSLPPVMPKPSSKEPAMQKLARRASADPELKILMRNVTVGTASPQQLKAFQGHMDEVKASLPNAISLEDRVNATMPVAQRSVAAPTIPPPPSALEKYLRSCQLQQQQASPLPPPHQLSQVSNYVHLTRPSTANPQSPPPVIAPAESSSGTRKSATTGQLIEMGFSADRAHWVAQQVDGDIGKALDMLDEDARVWREQKGKAAERVERVEQVPGSWDDELYG